MKSKFIAAIPKLLSLVPFFYLSWIKSKVYRALGGEIGEHVKFAPGAFLFVSDFKKLKIGDGVELGHDVKFNCEGIEIGEDTRISYGVVATGPSTLKIGTSCYFAPRVHIDLNEPVIIEDDVCIAADHIFTHSIWHPVTEGGSRHFAPVHVKKGAWIAAGVFLMPGVTVGEKATVGARSLVLRDVPDGCVAVGIPARVVKRAEENKKELSLEEKDRIVRDIIDDYLRENRKHLTVLSESKHLDKPFQVTAVESKEKEKFLGGKKSWVLLYTDDVIEPNQLDYMKELCKKCDFVLFVSLAQIPSDILENLNAQEFKSMFWFSVEGRIRKKSWNKDAMALHNFFRSHYGIRFKLHRSQR